MRTTLACLLAALMLCALCAGCMPDGKTIADFLPMPEAENTAPVLMLPKPPDAVTPTSVPAVETPAATPPATSSATSVPAVETPAATPPAAPAASPQPAVDNGVAFKDASFEAAVRDYLQIPEGPILPERLNAIATVHVSQQTISDYADDLDCESLPVPFAHSLGDLKRFPNVTRVYLEQLSDFDLEFQRDMPQLTSLVLYRCYTLKSFSDFTNEGSFNAITSLSVIQCPNLEELGQHSRFPSLGSLTLIDCASLEDISMLSECGALEELQISASRVSDISPLSGLAALKRLSLASCRVTDVGPLSNLPLAALDVSDNFIRDITPLQTLSDLLALDVRRNDIRNIDVTAKMKSLTYLDVSGNPVSSLKSVFGLTALNYLDVSNTLSTGLKGLDKLKTLRSFCAVGFAPAELAALSKLSELREVGLDPAQAAKYAAELSEKGVTVRLYNEKGEFIDYMR